MAKGYDVTNLTNYVKENTDLLIRDAVLGSIEGDSIAKMRKQLGVKGKEKLNYLNVDPTLQAADGCGFNPQGKTEFTARDVETKRVKVNDEFCDANLINYWMEYLVKIGAKKDAMPFEAEIFGQVVKGINKQMEKNVWQGNTTLGITGLLPLADTGGADAASTINVAIAKGTSIYDAVQQVYMALPEEILDDEDTFIGLSPANFRKFTQELVKLDYSHYAGPINENVKEFIFPGSNVKVREIQGLIGKDNDIYASTFKNLVYACDLLSDKEEIDAWYSQDNRTFRYVIEFNAGVTTLFPDAVVLGKIATA